MSTHAFRKQPVRRQPGGVTLRTQPKTSATATELHSRNPKEPQVTWGSPEFRHDEPWPKSQTRRRKVKMQQRKKRNGILSAEKKSGQNLHFFWNQDLYSSWSQKEYQLPDTPAIVSQKFQMWMSKCHSKEPLRRRLKGPQLFSGDGGAGVTPRWLILSNV